jgi:4-aminobutyrate aminotransferase-like enzyme
VSIFRTAAAMFGAPVAAPRAEAERVVDHPHLLKNYARAPITIARGEGCELIDSNGVRYLDFVAGIAVCALGHAHPDITRAIATQAATLVQASNLFYHEPSGTLANELAERSGLERVFFCNSGTEANEAAIKLARKYAFRRGDSRRTILSCEGSFHGRTLGALTSTRYAIYGGRAANAAAAASATRSKATSAEINAPLPASAAGCYRLQTYLTVRSRRARASSICAALTMSGGTKRNVLSPAPLMINASCSRAIATKAFVR